MSLSHPTKAQEMAEKVAKALKAREEGVLWADLGRRFGGAAVSAAKRELRRRRGLPA